LPFAAKPSQGEAAAAAAKGHEFAAERMRIFRVMSKSSQPTIVRPAIGFERKSAPAFA